MSCKCLLGFRCLTSKSIKRCIVPRLVRLLVKPQLGTKPVEEFKPHSFGCLWGHS